MVVTCENCKTRFNLDENLVKESGSKVRCSKCHHIFIFYKSVPVEEPEPALELEEVPSDMPESAGVPSHSAEEEKTPEEVLDFDLPGAEQEPAEKEIDLEAFGLEKGPSAEEPSPVEEEVALDEGPGLEQGEPVIEGTLATSTPPPLAEKEPWTRRRISPLVMIALVLALLAGGAFAAYGLLKTYDINIPFLQSFTGAPGPGTIDPGKLRITPLEGLIRSEFVENSTLGRLFVIKGKVRNDYPEARSFIMVKGLLYSKDGKAIQEKAIYCGNALSDTDLQSLDKATMEKRLRNRFGDERSNFRVPSGSQIPFVVVFSDLPHDLGEFSVEVVSSAPA